MIFLMPKSGHSDGSESLMLPGPRGRGETQGNPVNEAGGQEEGGMEANSHEEVSTDVVERGRPSFT